MLLRQLFLVADVKKPGFSAATHSSAQGARITGFLFYYDYFMVFFWNAHKKKIRSNKMGQLGGTVGRAACKTEGWWFDSLSRLITHCSTVICVCLIDEWWSLKWLNFYLKSTDQFLTHHLHHKLGFIKFSWTWTRILNDWIQMWSVMLVVSVNHWPF